MDGGHGSVVAAVTRMASVLVACCQALASQGFRSAQHRGVSKCIGFHNGSLLGVSKVVIFRREMPTPNQKISWESWGTMAKQNCITSSLPRQFRITHCDQLAVLP